MYFGEKPNLALLSFENRIPLQCVSGGNTNFTNTLIGDTLTPLVVALTCISIDLYVRKFTAEETNSRSRKVRRSPSMDSTNRQSRSRSTYLRINETQFFFQAFLLVTYVVLPSCSRAIFSVFRCTTFIIDADGHEARYLTADLSIECSGPQYNLLLGYTSVMILVRLVSHVCLYNALSGQKASFSPLSSLPRTDIPLGYTFALCVTSV